MARVLRGDIVWADLNPVQGREQAGRRLGRLAPEETEQVVAGLEEILGR